jgi:dTDP-4-amino-4,6-dideoxygalactose transaminase
LFQSQTITLANIPDVNKKRNAWMDQLQQVGISTRPATHAVHMLTFYRDKYKIKPNDFPNSYMANDCSISLPLFHGMTEEEQDYVINQVLKVKV